jgi:hypothetical protein
MGFESGKWLVICDRCGFQRKSDQVVKTWDGHMVCAPSTGKFCFETRHPQEFVRSRPDIVSVPFTRPHKEIHRVVPFIDSSVGVQEPNIPRGTFGPDLPGSGGVVWGDEVWGSQVWGPNVWD